MRLVAFPFLSLGVSVLTVGAGGTLLCVQHHLALPLSSHKAQDRGAWYCPSGSVEPGPLGSILGGYMSRAV